MGDKKQKKQKSWENDQSFAESAVCCAAKKNQCNQSVKVVTCTRECVAFHYYKIHLIAFY